MNIDQESEIERRLRAKKAAKLGLKMGTPDGLPTEEKEPADDSPIEHNLSSKVLTLISLRRHTWLTGPAGSGKSKCIEQQATKLNLPFYCPPIGRETTSSQLMGYFNAAGNYVRTPLREAVEFGGIVHFEEFDFASAAVGTATNAVLANDLVGFPDQVVQKHKDFVVLASANTYGSGASAQYIGSTGLNAATLDRFVFLDFPYDEKMEKRLAPNKAWCAHVQAVRRKVTKLGLKVVVSPRATINGGLMVESKAFTMEEIEAMTLWKGIDQMSVDKIKAMSSL